jgi:hypothetical protein
MSRIVFDEPAWWQRRRWRVAVAVALTVVAVVVWWAALTPPDHAPAPRSNVSFSPSASFAAARPEPQPTEPIASRAPPATAAPNPPAATRAPTQPPLSTMVAPGVHITPLSVPPGTVPAPAGPTERDSEPEN